MNQRPLAEHDSGSGTSKFNLAALRQIGVDALKRKRCVQCEQEYTGSTPWRTKIDDIHMVFRNGANFFSVIAEGHCWRGHFISISIAT